MRILIVGAGAIGQVYAYHLQRAGHEVYFFAKEKYAEVLKGEQYLYPLNRSHPRRAPVSFRVQGVITSAEEAAQWRWDQVYLCMSSTGLQGPWLEPFAAAIPEATVISLQSGMTDRDYLLKYFPSDRLVCGMLSIISYHAPLEGEVVPRPGMAYWFPPLSPSPFSGEGKRTREVVDALNQGGYPAKVVKDVPSLIAIPSAVLMNLIAGLELADWSFDKMRDPRRLTEVCQAIGEASKVLSKKEGIGTPLAVKLISPVAIRALMKLAPVVIPLDIETYLKAHFTKVGDQTRMYMKGYVEEGKGLGVKVLALEELNSKLNAIHID